MSDIEIDAETGEVRETPKLGRPRRNMAQTRGRPAAPQIAAQGDDDDGATLTRRSRIDSSQNDFDVPAHMKRQGWDYQYFTTRIIGQDVDGADLARVYEGGWRPVSAKDMPSLTYPGYKGKNIERGGQILMTRPMRLSLEAKREDYEIAEKQKQDKLIAASAVNTGRPSSMPTVVSEMTIEGSVGTHRAA